MRDPDEVRDWFKAFAWFVIIAAIAYFGWQVVVR